MKKIIEHIRPLEWVRDPGKHADGSLLRFVGDRKITVASTGRAIGSKSKPDEPLWCVNMRLPGIALKKTIEGMDPRFMTEQEAKDQAERLAMIWFDWIGE